MKVNTKTRYGIRTLMELARNDSGAGMHQKDIAVNQDISYKYLDHIIAQLKSSGLIVPVSGRKSGYRLTRKPEEIAVYDVFTAFNSTLALLDCLFDGELCEKHERCAAREFWDGLNSVIENYLKDRTIGDLIDRQSALESQQGGLAYQI